MATRNAGDSCQPQSIFCADGDGASARYLKCVHGELVEGFCPHDSMCVGSKGTTIICATDHPSNSIDSRKAEEPSKATTTMTTTLTVIVHSQPVYYTSAPVLVQSSMYIQPKPPALLLAPKSADHQMPMASTLSTTPLLNGSPTLPFVQIEATHLSNTEQGQYRPAMSPQSIHQLLQHPALPTPSIQIKSHDQPIFVAPNIADYKPISQHPSPISFARNEPNVSPTGVSDPFHHHQLEPQPRQQQQHQKQPQPLSTMRPPLAMHPAMLQNSDNPIPKSTAPSLIGGIEAGRLLSVVGNAILSRVTETPSVYSVTQDTGTAEPHVSTTSTTTTSALGAATGAADVPGPLSRTPDDYMLYSPQPLVPAICNPGSFVCARHGLESRYFACDSAGVAILATCAPNEACYQYGESILCSAPGGAPNANVLLK
ncbi:hypothetical protein GGI26_000866 [Coemansia sp. RSA 1358]|nr:hypothetical protein EDC05_000845 [Coemansia umbellata]KAJ2625063.1 hypothetical protein GGI26_000866 [Coemansia sp. RSA 1358]